MNVVNIRHIGTLPFGQAVRLWRLHRGLTQEQLAQHAHVPRTNLSAIERGERDVSLSTLRALAYALDVRAGILADGLPPGPSRSPMALSRKTLERVAEALVRNTSGKTSQEQEIIALARRLVSHRASATQGCFRMPRRHRRADEAAWLLLRSRYGPSVVRALAERIDERRRMS